MPIYEYRCGDCGHLFSLLQPMGSDGSDLNCPSCGASEVERLLSAFASGSSKPSASAAASSSGCSPFT